MGLQDGPHDVAKANGATEPPGRDIARTIRRVNDDPDRPRVRLQAMLRYCSVPPVGVMWVTAAILVAQTPPRFARVFIDE